MTEAQLRFNSKLIRFKVIESLDEIADQACLKTHERVKTVLCTDMKFTVANGLLTPDYKLNKEAIRAMFQKEISGLM